MSYLLDTSACVPLFAGKINPTLTRLRFELARTKVFVPTVVLFELWYGVHRSEHATRNSSRAARLLSLGIEALDFSGDDAETAGRIRAGLQASKQSIGPYDTLIAGQALARNLTLVTANYREFDRVNGLVWEDWS